MKPHNKSACEYVIRYGESYAARQGLEWSLDARYPRLPFDGYQSERARWEAWYVDSLVNCAYALLNGQDLRFALRCMFQAREYAGRLEAKYGVGAPDSGWHDQRTNMQNALEDALGCDGEGVANHVR